MGECYSVLYYTESENIPEEIIIDHTINFINNKCIVNINESISSSLLIDAYESYIKNQLSENDFNNWVNNSSSYQRLSILIDAISQEHNCYFTTAGFAVLSGITLKKMNNYKNILIKR